MGLDIKKIQLKITRFNHVNMDEGRSGKGIINGVVLRPKKKLYFLTSFRPLDCGLLQVHFFFGQRTTPFIKI